VNLWPARPGRFALLLAALACSPAKNAPAATPTEQRPTRVLVGASGGKTLSVKVEVARTDAERQRGLMERTQLGADQGMLFVFAETGRHAFWMKNTLIPLDMLFIDELGRITGTVENAEPQSLTSREGGPSRYVLEVNGGTCAAWGVKPGDRVRFEGPIGSAE
jgi:uncharacterized membrane protein (UPF0127 family)